MNGYLLSFKVNSMSLTCDLLKASDTFAKATREQLANLIVDAVGVGFHWPELDEDLSVNGILKEAGISLPVHGSERGEHVQLA